MSYLLSVVLLNVMVPTCMFQKLKCLTVCLIAFTIALNMTRGWGDSDYATYSQPLLKLTRVKGLQGTNTPAYFGFDGLN